MIAHSQPEPSSHQVKKKEKSEVKKEREEGKLTESQTRVRFDDVVVQVLYRAGDPGENTHTHTPVVFLLYSLTYTPAHALFEKQFLSKSEKKRKTCVFLTVRRAC